MQNIGGRLFKILMQFIGFKIVETPYEPRMECAPDDCPKFVGHAP